MDIQKKIDKRALHIYARFFGCVGTVLLGIIYAVALAATLMYGVVNFTSKDYIAYYNAMVEEHDYYERADENIKSALEKLDLPEGITAEGIYSSLDSDEYKVFAGKYLVYVCQKVFNSPEETFNEIYDTDSLDSYLSGIENPKETKKQITACVTEAVKFLPDEKYSRTFNTVSDILEKRTEGKIILADIYNIVKGSAFCFVDAFLIAAVVIFLIYKINQKHGKRCFYIIGSVAFLSSVATLLPAAYIYKAFGAYSTVLENSFSRDLLAIAHGRTANALIIWAAVIFVISSIVFIASLVVYAPHRAKIRRPKKKGH